MCFQRYILSVLIKSAMPRKTTNIKQAIIDKFTNVKNLSPTIQFVAKLPEGLVYGCPSVDGLVLPRYDLDVRVIKDEVVVQTDVGLQII